MNKSLALSLFAAALVSCGTDAPSSTSAQVDAHLPSNVDAQPIAGDAPAASPAAAPTPRPGEPAALVEAAVTELRDGRVSGFLRLMAPPEELEAMRAQWLEAREKPMPAEEDAQFRMMMTQLTAEGAEETLFLMVQPQLAEAQQQLGMLAAMGPMMAAGALEQQGAEAQEEMATAMGQLAEKVAAIDIVSEDKAREAIAVVVSAARALELPSAEAMRKLEFDEVLQKADVAWGAVLGVLDVYDMSLDSAFESVSAKLETQEGDRAIVSVTLSIFGQEQDPFPVFLERIDGSWYGAER